MLGRETTSLLDLLYEMPQDIKDIPSNQWVWILRERLKTAQKIMRTPMHSQIDIILDGPFLIVRKLSDCLYEVFVDIGAKIVLSTMIV